jgi:hypothetical protein
VTDKRSRTFRYEGPGTFLMVLTVMCLFLAALFGAIGLMVRAFDWAFG